MKPLLLRWLVIGILTLLGSAHVFADGKIYIDDKIPTSIPYQRAAILFSKGTETLILQSQYQIPVEPGKHTLGWVVPVPTVPEIASMDARWADHFFFELAHSSRPRVTRIGEAFWLAALGICLCVAPITLVLSSLRKFERQRSNLRLIALLALGAFVVSLSVALLGARAWKGIGDVEVLRSEKVGIHDVQVVRSDSPAALIEWFNRNSLRFGPDDEKAIRSHIDRGWCFVASKVSADVDPTDSSAVLKNLLAPLILRFPTPNPVYPTALTATGGHPTEILIYLASDIPMKTESPLTLRFHGKLDDSLPGSSDLLTIEPFEFVKTQEIHYRHLSKFKATLTPAQMEKDIEFTPDPAARPYREHVYRW